MRAPTISPEVEAVRPDWTNSTGRQRFRWILQWRAIDLWAPAAFLAFLVIVCFVIPLVGHIPSPISGNVLNVNLPLFSRGHLLGTDPQGYDELSRLLYGGRISIEVGLGSVAISLAVGGTLGGLAGLRGGRFESVVMRILDVLLAFPALILAVTISSYFGENELNVIWAIGFVFTAAFGRLARAQALSVRQRTFVLAARLNGQNDRKIFFRHIVPNIIPNLATFGVLLVGVAIGLEAAISYLGAGVPPPGPSWGNMINLGQTYITLNPRLIIVPSAALFLTITALNLLSDALRSRWATT